MLMNNSQVFLAFALPFSMIPLIMMTDSKETMGRFKNSLPIKFFGWVSVISLTVLNLKGLPDSITDFFGENPSAFEVSLAHGISYVLIVAILLLLAWTMIEVKKGDKHLAQVNKH